VIEKKKELVHARDKNGWTPLHEAIRANCYDCVMNLVIEGGADVNALTADGRSPLFYAKKYDKKKSHNNMISQFLKRYGALEVGPEL
jgi:ankyrin repeat protein